MGGSDRERAKAALLQFLQSVEKENRWWFVLKLSDEDPNSLASLLGLTTEELDKFMLACGFCRTRDNGFKQDEFLSFVRGSGLDTEVDACYLSVYNMNKAHVIRIGTKERTHLDFLKARDQFADPDTTEARRPRFRGVVVAVQHNVLAQFCTAT